MPQVQVVNTSANDTPNRVEENLKTFFSKMGKEYKEKEDQNKIADILKEHAANQGDKNQIFKSYEALDRSNIGPTKRLQEKKNLKELEELTIEKDKSIATQAKAVNEALKEQKEKTRAKESVYELYKGHLPEEEARRLSEIDTEATARAKIKEATKGPGGKPPGQEFAKLRETSVSKYVNEAFHQQEQAEEQKFAIAEARNAVAGNIAGPGFKAALKHNPYTQLIIGLTPDEAALQATNKKLLEGSKGIFGAKPTEREIFLLLNEMLPSIGKTQEANDAGIDFIEKVNDLKLARSEIISRLTNGGSKYVDNLEQQVNEELKPLFEALRDELKDAVKKFYPDKAKSLEKNNKQMKVKAPDGTFWNMTQSQIEDAKSKGVIFEPVKQ